MRFDFLVSLLMDSMGGEGSGGGGGGAPAGSAGGAAGSAGDAGGASGGAQPAAGAPGGIATPPADAGPGAVVPPVVYTPKGKFKVAGKEQAVAPWLLSAIKEEAHEKELVELHEKAFGLEKVKGHRDQLQSEVSQVKQHYQTLATEVKQASDFVRAGDYGSFFSMLGIPEEAIIKYAVDRVKMSPEAKAAEVREREARSQGTQAQSQVEQLNSQIQRQAAQIRSQELTGELSKPEVSSVRQAFDAAHGDGAFWNEVVARGRLALQMSGKDITAAQAVSEVVRLIGPGYSTPKTTPGAENAGGAPVGGAPAKPQVIPVVKGSGASPAKTRPKNLDDLRKMAATFQG